MTDHRRTWEDGAWKAFLSAGAIPIILSVMFWVPVSRLGIAFVLVAAGVIGVGVVMLLRLFRCYVKAMDKLSTAQHHLDAHHEMWEQASIAIIKYAEMAQSFVLGEAKEEDLENQDSCIAGIFKDMDAEMSEVDRLFKEHDDIRM